MTAITLKKRIQKAIDNVDESVLKEVYAILDKAQKKSPPLKPMTMKEFRARIARSEKELREGKGIPHEDVKRRFGIK